jgi:hypothetical protein
MIDVFQYSLEKQIEVQSLPDPKHVWVDGDRIVVYTGDDVTTHADPGTDV